MALPNGISWALPTTDPMTGRPVTGWPPVRTGYDPTLDVDPPLDEHDPIPFHTHHRHTPSQPNQQQRELGYDQHGNYVGGEVA
jgi:hypothetical protein